MNWLNDWHWWGETTEDFSYEKKSNECYHIWLEKPLFNHIHKMCDKCGMLYEEYEREKSASINYYD